MISMRQSITVACFMLMVPLIEEKIYQILHLRISGGHNPQWRLPSFNNLSLGLHSINKSKDKMG